MHVFFANFAWFKLACVCIFLHVFAGWRELTRARMQGLARASANPRADTAFALCLPRMPFCKFAASCLVALFSKSAQVELNAPPPPQAES